MISQHELSMKVCYTFHATIPMMPVYSELTLDLNFNDFENDEAYKARYEIRVDSMDEPFTEARNVTSSGQRFFLVEGSSYRLNLYPKYYRFLPSGTECNDDSNYDYRKVICAKPYHLSCLRISKNVIQYSANESMRNSAWKKQQRST